MLGDNYPIFKNEYTPEEIAQMAVVDRMRENITKLGNDRVWRFVESWKNPMIRYGYRDLFFKAGGKIPERSNNENI